MDGRARFLLDFLFDGVYGIYWVYIVQCRDGGYTFDKDFHIWDIWLHIYIPIFVFVIQDTIFDLQIPLLDFAYVSYEISENNGESEKDGIGEDGEEKQERFECVEYVMEVFMVIVVCVEYHFVCVCPIYIYMTIYV